MKKSIAPASSFDDATFKYRETASSVISALTALRANEKARIKHSKEYSIIAKMHEVHKLKKCDSIPCSC
jgi:hypothetical protein